MMQPEQLATPSGSDVILDLPGPGNNQAFGNCRVIEGLRHQFQDLPLPFRQSGQLRPWPWPESFQDRGIDHR